MSFLNRLCCSISLTRISLRTPRLSAGSSLVVIRAFLWHFCWIANGIASTLNALGGWWYHGGLNPESSAWRADVLASSTMVPKCHLLRLTLLGGGAPNWHDEFIWRLTYAIAPTVWLYIPPYALCGFGMRYFSTARFLIIAEIWRALSYCCIWLQSIYIVRLGTSSKYLCSLAVDRILSTIPKGLR